MFVQIIDGKDGFEHCAGLFSYINIMYIILRMYETTVIISSTNKWITTKNLIGSRNEKKT